MGAASYSSYIPAATAAKDITDAISLRISFPTFYIEVLNEYLLL